MCLHSENLPAGSPKKGLFCPPHNILHHNSCKLIQSTCFVCVCLSGQVFKISFTEIRSWNRFLSSAMMSSAWFFVSYYFRSVGIWTLNIWQCYMRPYHSPDLDSHPWNLLHCANDVAEETARTQNSPEYSVALSWPTTTATKLLIQYRCVGSLTFSRGHTQTEKHSFSRILV